jgi:hypothetical protein
MKIVYWLRYILQCLNAIVQGIEVVINHWPTGRPGAYGNAKGSEQNTPVDIRPREQKQV